MTELDPAVAAFLADFALAPTTPLAQTTPPLFRSEAYQWKKYQGEPVEVDQVIHEFLTTPTADIPVRIYIPKTTSTKPLRALIFLHGSGWTSNNIELADTPHRLLAHLTETIVIAPNYQKSPEHRFPIPLQDSLATLAWVQENAERFGVDPTRIGIGGDSAGGNLAAAVSLFTIDNGLAATYKSTLETVMELSGKRLESIQIIGGGSQIRLLNQLTADICGVPVQTGPVEATLYGNIAVQVIAAGLLPNLKAAREAIAANASGETFFPSTL